MLLGYGLAIGYVSKIVVALLIRLLLLGRLGGNTASNRFLAVTVGVTLYTMVTTTPFLGFLLELVAILLGLGAIWMALYPRLRRPAAPAALEPVPAAN